MIERENSMEMCQSKLNVEREDLRNSLLLMGLDQSYQQLDDADNCAVAQGKLSFDMFPSGIGIHCADLIEQESARSTVILSPCISFNLLIQGQVSYQLADKSYQFKAEETPCLFVNVLGKKEVFTRYLHADQVVKKMNITVEKNWLMARCSTQQEKKLISALFSKNAHVYSLPCSKTLIQFAEQLLRLKLLDITGKIRAENIALAFIEHCLPMILTQNLNHQIDEHIHMNTNTEVLSKENDGMLGEVKHCHNELDSLLEQAIEMHGSLQDISGKLGLSISTLQRQVKAKYSMTVSEYLRKKRLERAKKLFIIEGKSIGEAAYLAGYTHVANFITAFKKHYNATPAQLRKLHFNQQASIKVLDVQK